MKAVRVLGFLGTLAQKIPGAIMNTSNVERIENASKTSQTLALVQGPSLVFTCFGTDKSRPVSFYVGSGMDAAVCAFDVVVNCAIELQPNEYNPTPPADTIYIPLRDNNFVRLQETRLRDAARAIISACTTVKGDARHVNALIHCSWGASRSVAVCIWLLHHLVNKNATVDEWYDIIRSARPSVNMSVRLRKELQGMFASSQH
jgi:hypothetical protein